MKNLLIIALLIVAAGCATSRGPEPVAPLLPEASVKPAPAAPVEKPTPITRQPALPAPEGSQPGAVEKVISKSGHAETPKPAISVLLLAPTSKQTETPAVEKRKKPSAETRDKGATRHKSLSLAEFAAANDNKLMNVYAGMYKKTVEMIMGTDRNPYRKTKIAGAKGQVYEVLFYLTREPRQGKPITDRMLWPIIFRKGRVVAMGHYKLKKLLINGTLERKRQVLSVQQYP
jgi:hypothetical protein